MLNTIQDWDLFLLFLIVDGCTRGKDHSKLVWFIQEVKHYKQTVVDESWDRLNSFPDLCRRRR